MSDVLILLLFLVYLPALCLCQALEARLGRTRAMEILSKPSVRAYLVFAALSGFGLVGVDVYSAVKSPVPFEWVMLIPYTMTALFAAGCPWLLWVATLPRQRMESSRWVFRGERGIQKDERFIAWGILAIATVIILMVAAQSARIYLAQMELGKFDQVVMAKTLSITSGGLVTRHIFVDGLEVSRDSTGTVSTKWLTKGNPPLSGRDYFFALLWPLLSVIALWLWKRLTPRSEILGGLFGIIALLLAFGQIPFILFALFS